MVTGQQEMQAHSRETSFVVLLFFFFHLTFVLTILVSKEKQDDYRHFLTYTQYPFPLNFMSSSVHSHSFSYLPIVQETRVQSLGQEDPLKKGMATHSIILAWRISWTEEPGYSP